MGTPPRVKLVRSTPGLRYRIYRPAVVVGDSRTGEMDKIDGPYYFFGVLSKLAVLPRFTPLMLPDTAHWLAFAYMVLIGNVIAYLVWFRLVERLPTVVVGIGSLVVPCIGVLSSHCWNIGLSSFAKVRRGVSM